MSTRSNHQGGWIVGFVAVGVLLVATLVGGVYFLKTSQDQGSSIKTDDTSTTQPTETDKERSDTGSSSKHDDTRPAENKERSKQREKTTEPERHKDSVETPRVSKEKQETEENRAQQDAQTHEAELPQTGPAETAVSLLAVGLLTFAAAAYVRSRQTV